ncbi:hypothetical protein F2Q69_00022983 [Brassica cretica]|uniref:Uncharacterized protein n=1 Tax=Brassica cretica TaxID=69181 RepID=A0A8S9QNV7_BRACR|nr:hypothetical protein F2Q69_00022983 [Brassica cretica]
MRGDTWAHTCREACTRQIQGDTPTSTSPPACTAFIRCDTPSSACQSGYVVLRYCDTSCYDLSSCMFSTHARLHFVLVLTLRFLYARYHVMAICVETPQASWDYEFLHGVYWGKIFHKEITPTSGFQVPVSRFRVPAPGAHQFFSRQGKVSHLEDLLLRHAYDRLTLAVTTHQGKIYAHRSTSTTLLPGSGHDLQLISRVTPCSLKHLDTSCSLQLIDRSTICSGHVPPKTDDSYQLQSYVHPRLHAH